MSKLYDENNKNSILKYARRLEGKTLREVLPDEEIDEIIEDSYERIGLQNVSGYQLKTAKRSLNILFSILMATSNEIPLKLLNQN